MKTLRLTYVLVLFAILVFSCQPSDIDIQKKSEIEILEATDDSMITYYDQEKGETITFNSPVEVINYFEDTEYSDLVSSKMNSFITEKAYIEKHKLYDLPDDHELVVNYIKRFASEDASTPATENAIGGRLFDGSFSTGEKLSSTTSPVPRMRREFRNRASSVRGGTSAGTVLLFNRTWYRGNSELILVAPFLNSNINSLNNRSESFL